ncbi:hypothetical protein [Microbacterium ulmi]|uniref:Uncharacterized protein n=1 Tax=Microbacterium ulmi TaxID=179095 RepID=A0A7Y2LX62_9MICO|nr:hypothetical protein [Microbacterium ulmi]NII71145.1 hypothetical protein [Microbacterium ulmi]NNH02452.1 hypothetical protein [Microbacterium ulmi]
MGGKVLDEVRHPGVDGAVLDDVEVVEHQRDVGSSGIEVVDQRGDDRLGRRRIGRQDLERSAPDSGTARSNAVITWVLS